MGFSDKIAQYKAWRTGVKHCTLDPEGPGVVRIHLVPPKFRIFGRAPYIAILNGYYLLPIGYSWAMLLSAFMDEVNLYDGKVIDVDAERGIATCTVDRVARIYPSVGRDSIEEDLACLLDVVFKVARGRVDEVDGEIGRLSVRAYSRNMSAPHRMDLMISAMTDEAGAWKCNQRCVFCYAAGQSLGSCRELTAEEWKKAIDKLRLAGVPMLTFTGGEPTLRSDLCEIISYAKWFVTRLNTNGVCLTEELTNRLKAASLDSVQITLYSHSAEIHNSLVGCERHRETVKGIRNAVRAGLDVSVNTPLCALNSDYLKTLEFISSLGVRFVTVSGLICTGMAESAHGAHDLSEDQLFCIVREAKQYCDAHGMEMDFTSPGLIAAEKLESLRMNVPSCGAALSNMAIAPDGTVVPCQSWLKNGSGLGNILTDGWKVIWNHAKCRSLRAMSEEKALSCPFRNSDVDT